MTALAWAGFAILATVALGLTSWLYLRREPPGRGRLLLALLRGAALVLVLLLLFDPRLPARERPGAARAPAVLLDASASMALPRAPGDSATRWSAALAEARARARGRPVLLFGDVPRPVAPDSIPASPPGDARSLLLPALRVAAEAGARRVLVLTDAELEDAASLAAWQSRLGLDVEWQRVGQPLPGAGLVEVRVPAWARAGEAIEVEAVLRATAGAAPRRLVVRQGGRVLAEADAPLPSEGRVSRLALPVRPAAAADGELARIDVALEPADALAADDRRTVLLHVSPEPAGVVLVSGRPDWEPRFLLPVLERALGLPAQGYLQLTPGVWTRLGDGNVAGRRASEGDVVRAARTAALLVLHAPPASPPGWLRDALAAAPATLVLATAAGTAIPFPVEPVADDWFATGPVPASPVAGLLAGVELADAPPLDALLSAEIPAGAWAPLLATRRRAGRPWPVLVAGSEGGKRWAVALAQGYWRWAFQPGEPRQLYERLWSAVGGWLVADAGTSAAGAVRPVRRVVSQGQRAGWVAAGVVADSIRLRASAGTGATLDTLLVRAGADTLAGPLLAPGSWRYEATAWGTDGRTARGSGQLVIESYSEELARPRATLETLRARTPVGPAARTPGASAPLHARPWPWVLIVLLLATEWVLRRRWGLR